MQRRFLRESGRLETVHIDQVRPIAGEVDAILKFQYGPPQRVTMSQAEAALIRGLAESVDKITE